MGTITTVAILAIAAALSAGTALQMADANLDLLQAATYDADAGILTLHFPGTKIDPSSMDEAVVYVYGPIKDTVIVPSASLSLVEADERSAVFLMTPNDLYAEYAIDDPFARIENVTDEFGQVRTSWNRLNVLGDAPPIISAEYVVETNQLVLDHIGSYDPFSVDPTRVSIRDNHTSIAMTADEYVWPDNIYASFTAFELSTVQQLSLIAMDDPVVWINDTMIDHRGTIEMEPIPMEPQVRIFPLTVKVFTSLERAEYVTYTNELTLYFTTEINPLSTGTGYVSIAYEDYRDIVLHVESARVGEDLKSVTFELPPYERFALSLMIDEMFMPLPILPDETEAEASRPKPQKPPTLAVYLEPGAVARASDGFRNGMEWVTLDVRGDSVLLLDPSVPDGVIAGRAENRQGASEVVLYFREPIDPSSINPSRIAIERDACARYTPLETDPVRVGDDGRWAAFWVNAAQVGLLSSHNIWVHLEREAFRTQADGTENDPGYVRMLFNHKSWAYRETSPWFSKEPMAGGHCHITYRIEMSVPDNPRHQASPSGPQFWQYVAPAEMLSDLGYDQAFIDRHIQMMASAVRDGLQEWSELNPGIMFEEVTDGEPDLIVTWIDGSVFGGGFACLRCVDGNAHMSLSFVDAFAIDGVRALHGHQLIKKITMHEFGHILGLLHHADKNHLMWGEDDYLQDPYNRHGYNIP